ncbi:RED-like protein N-terminal region-domain-containing protein [Kickxella alabastrina]|uniref:RED-like protein N-terminal region-domain-containing protein n=1 Tax=Kickxella alabastrina TaxID=61397 RepID=UPI00221E8A85|nr:RED-like protein N-terminal region-domain-containing protein [Kickxella alabastrina]KAI7818750.1 RED-like protein N-terminal region-domain-containing protein [Kickxella alabastrina]
MSNDPGRLTQSDFRKLLQTPGGPSSGATGDEERAGRRRAGVLGGRKQLHKAAKLTAEAPAAVQPTSAPTRKREHRPNKTDDNGPTNMYRDRAAERRQGTGDVEEDLVLGAGVEAYERSKFLGGDTEHTHLVKGLDFLLLDRVRAQGPASAQLDSELERLLEQNENQQEQKHDGKMEAAATYGLGAMTALGEGVLGVVQRMSERQANGLGLVKANEVFLPGRMYFEFDLGSSTTTTRIRSQEEVARIAGSSGSVATAAIQEGDRVVLAKVISAIAASRQRRRDAREHQQELLQEEFENPSPAPEPSVAAGENPSMAEDNSDDDIFAEAGVDYQVTIGDISHCVAGPAPDNDDDDDGYAVTAPYPESDSEFGVTAPYPEYDSEFGVTAPYPGFIDDDMAVAAPYPDSADSGDKEEGVNAPYPKPPSNSRPSKRPRTGLSAETDSDGEADMRLFSEARLRFKEETSDMLQHNAPSASSSSKRPTKASSTGVSNSEWQKTRKIMKQKYGIDITADKNSPE